MLERKENLKLFEEIETSLNINGNLSILSDSLLMRVKSLRINDIDSLKGIEKLVNLESLEIIGKEDSTNIFEYKKIYQKNRDNKDFDMQDVFIYYYGEYTKNQISEEDLKYIYKLKNLRYLDLSRQRNLKNIDLSNLVNLENLYLTECVYLKEIKNINKLKIINDDIKRLNIDLAGCYRLNKIEGINSIINKYIEIKNKTKNEIYLPTIYFSKIDDTFRKKVVNKIKCFNWSELCPGYRSDINDSNMLKAYELAIDIVGDCCKNDEDKMDKVSSIYKWVCNHIAYDYEGLKLNESSPLYDIREKYNKVIRSSYTTLYYKKGVCVGVSGLFNYLCSLVDVVALPAYCSAKQIDFRRKVLQNHQISKIYLKNKAYYFDPTFDLDAIEFEYFGKNKDEISNTHFLAMGEYGEVSGKSIQNILRVNGYMRNNKGKARGVFKKNKGYRR